AKCSFSSKQKTAYEIEKAERKQARKSRETTPSILSKPTERRQRAQHFLREQLARGPKQASVVEDAAAKAHVDEQALGQARADLGVITTRTNTGGVQAVQWSLPGSALVIGERRQPRACTLNRPVVSAFGQTGHRTRETSRAEPRACRKTFGVRGPGPRGASAQE